MSFDRLRVYDAGGFLDVDLPDWYREANRLCEEDRLDWHRALERVLDCEYTDLTHEGAWIQVRFWPSQTQGYFVLFETALGLVEQVLILNPIDWLPVPDPATSHRSSRPPHTASWWICIARLRMR